MKKLGKAFAAIAIVGAIAATGSAFTASQTVRDSYAGIGNTSIDGANAVNVFYTLDAPKTTIEAVTLVLMTDTRDAEVSLSLVNAVNPALCVDGAAAESVGVYDAIDDETTYVCTVSVATSAADNLTVVVADEDLQTP